MFRLPCRYGDAEDRRHLLHHRWLRAVLPCVPRDPNADVDDGSCSYPNDCPEDLNADGQISVADILLLLSDFGCSSDCDADLNDDGATNVNDILQILAAFGGECD